MCGFVNLVPVLTNEFMKEKLMRS